MSKTLCSVRKTIQKRIDWLNREISCETGIHWLTVYKIIYRDLQLNCVKRRRGRAQQLSETNRVARLQAAAVRGSLQFDFIWFRDEKCLPSNHHSTRRTIGFMHQSVPRSDTPIPAATHAHNIQQVSYGVRWRVNNGYDWTNIFWIDPRVKVNGQYYCDVLLSQQMLPAIKRVAERCLFTKQYVAYGEICHFFVFCDFPR